MLNVGGWIEDQWRTYVGNAGSVRDLRSNMRGWNTPVILFCYLGFMVLASGVFYIGAANNSGAGGASTISQIQGALNGFSMMVLAVTELLVGLIAPALVCTAIVGEYQRRSIDLIFSSPVGTKYFLIGKLVSSYRYVVLLIFMVLPVLALGVVLGGTTMQWVATTLFTASMHGLLFAAVSLPIACTSAKVVPAVAFSILACVAVAIQPVILSIPTATAGPTFLTTLTPFLAFAAPSATTPIWGMDVPNWLLGALATLLLVRVFTVGAGSALSQAGSADTVSLRVHALVLVALVTVGVAVSTSTSLPFSASGTAGASGQAVTAFIASCYLFLALPFTSVWSRSADRKSYPNGFFNPKLLLRGTPASGLPFLLALMTVATLGSCLLRWIGDPGAIVTDAPYLFATWSFVLLGWSFGWFGSLLGGAQGVAGSRRLQIAFTVLFLTIPWVLTGWIGTIMKDSALALQLNPLTFIGSTPGLALLKGAAMLVGAVLLTFLAENGRRAQEAAKVTNNV